jgi:hypothetical protein
MLCCANIVRQTNCNKRRSPRYEVDCQPENQPRSQAITLVEERPWYKAGHETALYKARSRCVVIFYSKNYERSGLFAKISLERSEISLTHVKTRKLLQVCKQVVTNLFTSCQQVVFALLVPSCCNKFGTSC